MLKDHVGVHAVDGCFGCPICKKTFTDFMQVSNAGVHGTDWSRSCNLPFSYTCFSKIFRSYLSNVVWERRLREYSSFWLCCLPQVKKHMRCFHSEKIFQCPHCEKAFCRPDKLRLHMLRHSDRKDFLCSTCGKQFKVIRSEMLKNVYKKKYCWWLFLLFLSFVVLRGKISYGSTCSACTILTGRLRKPTESTAPKPWNWRPLPPTLRASCSNADYAWWDSDAEECWWVESQGLVIQRGSQHTYFKSVPITGQSFVEASPRDAYWRCPWVNTANYQA